MRILSSYMNSGFHHKFISHHVIDYKFKKKKIGLRITLVLNIIIWITLRCTFLQKKKKKFSLKKKKKWCAFPRAHGSQNKDHHLQWEVKEIHKHALSRFHAYFLLEPSDDSDHRCINFHFHGNGCIPWNKRSVHVNNSQSSSTKDPECPPSPSPCFPCHETSLSQYNHQQTQQSPPKSTTLLRLHPQLHGRKGPIKQSSTI